jgi:hypothetical protein
MSPGSGWSWADVGREDSRTTRRAPTVDRVTELVSRLVEREPSDSTGAVRMGAG